MRGFSLCQPAGAVFGAALAASVLAGAAEAGAWPQKPGDELLIVTASWHRLDAAHDGARLHKREAAFYGEYGLTQRFTLVGRVAFQDFRQEVRAGDKSLKLAFSTIGGSELGVRAHLVAHERWSGSLQLSSTLPSPGENRPNSARGDGGGDVEVRALLGRSIGRDGFGEIQLALREREGEDGNEIRIDTAFGWPLTDLFRMHVQTYSVWSNEIDTTRFEPFSGHRVELSLLASLGQGRYAQFGALTTVREDNMAEEFALMAGVWHRF